MSVFKLRILSAVTAIYLVVLLGGLVGTFDFYGKKATGPVLGFLAGWVRFSNAVASPVNMAITWKMFRNPVRLTNQWFQVEVISRDGTKHEWNSRDPEALGLYAYSDKVALHSYLSRLASRQWIDDVEGRRRDFALYFARKWYDPKNPPVRVVMTATDYPISQFGQTAASAPEVTDVGTYNLTPGDLEP